MPVTMLIPSTEVFAHQLSYQQLMLSHNQESQAHAMTTPDAETQL
jgi:hypothetical protein